MMDKKRIRRKQIDVLKQKKIVWNMNYILFELNASFHSICKELGIKNMISAYRRCRTRIPSKILLYIANKYNFSIDLFEIDSFYRLHQEVEKVKILHEKLLEN